MGPTALMRRLCYAPLHLVPRPFRQSLTAASATFMGPLIERSGRLPMPAFALGSYREFCVSAFLQSITHAGVEFDPAITVRGGDKIPRGASILISGHFYLNFLFIRWIHDNVGEPAVLLAHSLDKWLLQGTRKPMHVLSPDRHSLIRAREVLNARRPVVAAIDGLEPRGKDWTLTGIRQREVYVSGSLLKYAARSSTPLFFFDTFLSPSGKIEAVVEQMTSRCPEDEYSHYLSEGLGRREGAVTRGNTIAVEPATGLRG